MKKKVIGMSIASMFLLGACGSEEAEEIQESTEIQTEVASQEDAVGETKDSAVNVDKGLFNVEVTLPASFFEGEDLDQAIADAKANGVEEVTKNDDGSITYKMSKNTHKEMMAELETSVQEYITEMKTSEDFVSIQDVTAANDYSMFTMSVDKAAYENSFDSFSTLGLGMLGMYYQIFNGTEAEQVKVQVQVEDSASGEVFDTVIFPDDLEEEQVEE